MLEPLDDLGNAWELTDEVAEPGYYAATLTSGIRCELTVGPQECRAPLHVPGAPRRPARHRLLARRAGHPARRDGPAARAPGDPRARASPRPRSSSRARRWRCTWSATPRDWRQLLWYDRRLMPGGTRLDFDRIRPTTLRPFGSDVARPDRAPARCVELRFGFSLRGVEQAERNLRRDCGIGEPAGSTPGGPRPRPSGGSTSARSASTTPSAERRTVFATALYHSLIKPCFAAGGEPVLADATDRSCSTSARCGTSTGPSCR